MLRSLFRQSSVYALVGVVGKLGGLALLVFYADPEVLSKGDFGYLGQLDAAKMVALLLASGGLPLGIIQFASSSVRTEAERAAVPATALLLASLAGGIVLALGVICADPLAQVLLGDASRAEVVRWLAVYVGCKTVADVSYTVLRQRERAGTFVLIGAFEMVLLVTAVALFLVVFDQGLVGVMRGYALASGTLMLIVTPALLARIERRVRWGLVRPMLLFGLPLVASGFAGRFLNVGDRFLIVYFLGPEANAVYEWAARFGGVVNTFLVQSLSLAFTVLGLKALDSTGRPDLHRQTFRHFTALAGWVVLGLGLFVSDVSRLLTDDPEYIGADGLVVLVGAGFAFYGLYFVVVNVLYAAGRTLAVALATGAAALLNAALNVALIPAVGVAGAAVSTLIAYAALALGTAWLGQASSPVRYGWRSVVVVSAVVGALWAAAQPTEAWSPLARLGARGGLVLLYVPALWAGGVYGRADLRRAVGVLRGRTAGSTPPEG